MNFNELIAEINFDHFFLALGLSNLEADKKESFKVKILDLLSENIKIRLVSMLSDEEAKQFSDLNDVESLLNFYTNIKQVDLEALVIEEATNLREYLVTNMAYVQGSLQNPDDSAN
jgi:hypothetical protein